MSVPKSTNVIPIGSPLAGAFPLGQNMPAHDTHLSHKTAQTLLDKNHSDSIDIRRLPTPDQIELLSGIFSDKKVSAKSLAKRFSNHKKNIGSLLGSENTTIDDQNADWVQILNAALEDYTAHPVTKDYDNRGIFDKFPIFSIGLQQQLSYHIGPAIAFASAWAMINLSEVSPLMSTLSQYLLESNNLQKLSEEVYFRGPTIALLSIISTYFVAGFRGFLPNITIPTSHQEAHERTWGEMTFLEKSINLPSTVTVTLLGGSIALGKYFKNTGAEENLPKLSELKEKLKKSDFETLHKIKHSSLLIEQFAIFYEKQIQTDFKKFTESPSQVTLSDIQEFSGKIYHYALFNLQHKKLDGISRFTSFMSHLLGIALPSTKGDIKAWVTEYVQTVMYLMAVAAVTGSSKTGWLLLVALLMPIFSALNISIITEHYGNDVAKTTKVRQVVAFVQNTALAVIAGDIISPYFSLPGQLAVQVTTLFSLSYFLSKKNDS